MTNEHDALAAARVPRLEVAEMAVLGWAHGNARSTETFPELRERIKELIAAAKADAAAEHDEIAAHLTRSMHDWQRRYNEQFDIASGLRTDLAETAAEVARLAEENDHNAHLATQYFTELQAALTREHHGRAALAETAGALEDALGVKVGWIARARAALSRPEVVEVMRDA